MENTTNVGNGEGSGSCPPRSRTPGDSLTPFVVAVQANGSSHGIGDLAHAARAGNGDDQAYVDKKKLARRYDISERKVDYLREQGILPWHLIPPRSVRFKVAECDQAIDRYRRRGSNPNDK